MKAILVIDIEKKDVDIKTLRANFEVYGDIRIKPYYQFREGVELKPMPKKYIEHDITIETERDAAVCSHGITLGHNDVIKELEKPEAKSDLSTDEGWWRDYELYEMQND